LNSLSRPRSSLAALDSPMLFADALNAAFPREVKQPGSDSGDVVVASNYRLANMVAADVEERREELRVRMGRYRKGRTVPDRKTIGELSRATGVPPMVWMIYAGRFAEIFGYLKTLAQLTNIPSGWPLEKSSPRRAAFALGFSMFPKRDGDQSRVARQSCSAVSIFASGGSGLAHDVSQAEAVSASAPLAQHLAGSTTDGAFLLPAHPLPAELLEAPFGGSTESHVFIEDEGGQSDRDIRRFFKYNFTIAAEAQVDASSPLATWVFFELQPTALEASDFFSMAMKVLNDRHYPRWESFRLVGEIFEQWAHTTDRDLVDEVLSNLWRWDQRQLSSEQASVIMSTLD
jgi:hypothetical protein